MVEGLGDPVGDKLMLGIQTDFDGPSSAHVHGST